MTEMERENLRRWVACAFVYVCYCGFVLLAAWSIGQLLAAAGAVSQ